MKILPVIITTFALLVSCEKSAQTTAKDAAASKTAPEAPVTPATNNANTASTNTAGRPALNPAHGEPHHRCDIAVGAPIDSEPVAQNAAPQMTQPAAPATSFNTNPIAPSNAPASAPVTATGPKPALNPAHGQPHHRCDLEVGAPLT